MTNSIPEISTHSDVIFIVGSNTAECHPLIAKHVLDAQARGAKLIVADPRMTEMANKADLWLRVPPGYNVPLINSIIRVIVKAGLYNAEFIAEHVEGYQELAASVEEYTPDYVFTLTGIHAEDIVAAAHIFAEAKAAVILYCMGVTQFSIGTGNVVSLANLAVITGNIGRPGTGICPLRGQNNVQGACDMGCLPNSYPGYLPVNAEKNQEHFQRAWNVRLAPKAGLKLSQVPDAILDGRVKALYVFGENPVMSDPNVDHFIHAMESLDLLIVQDIFMSETARLAHLVLPAAGWGEKEGTFANTERRIQYVPKAVNPPGEARPDWWIITELARRMGYMGMNYAGPQDIWDEVRRVVPSQFGGISYKRLQAVRGIQWPCPNEEHPGTPVLYAGGKFSTPSGKARLQPVLFDAGGVAEAKVKQFKNPIVGHLSEPPDSEYPFVLTTGRRVYHYHTGTMTRKTPVLNQIGPEQLIELNPADAEALNIVDNDWLRVSTRRGVIAAKAWVTERVPAKTIFTTFHFWEANSNELTNSADLDPISGIPELKLSAAKVEKISADQAGLLLATKQVKYRVAMEVEA